MFGVELRVATVEIAHFTSPNICSANSQAGGMALDPREIHQFVQCPLERFRGVERSRTDAQRYVGTSEGKWIRLEKAWNAPATVSQFATSPPNNGNGAIA